MGALRPAPLVAEAAPEGDGAEAWSVLEARRLDDGKLLVRWSGGQYSHVECYWILLPARAPGEAEKSWQDASEPPAATVVERGCTLFLGFADGAPNVVVTDDPAPAEDVSRLRFVLVDNGTKRCSRVFAATPNKKHVI